MALYNSNKSAKNIATISLIGIITLTGCSYMPSMPKLWESDKKASAPAPHMQSVMVNNNASGSMQPSRSFNTVNLFSEKIRSDSGRLNRLENSVQTIRNELNTMRPSIDRLVAIEDDVQTLIGQLETIVQDGSAGTPIQEGIIPTATKVKNSSTEMPLISNNDASIHGVRVGEHPGKTRIVLDISAPTTFKADLDNNENILTIEIENTDWTAAKQKSFKNSAFITSYSVESLASNNGFIMVAQLKKSARIVYKDTIKSLNGKGRRIIIDLAN